MNDSLLYLKPNVVIEPLFKRWYAWSHLISPATAAMNITGRHLKIMNSYIQAPQIHAAAVKNPKMLGGPFMDFNGKQVEEVKKLRDDTLRDQRHMIAFSEAVKELDQLLKTHAKGHSMTELYEKVPDLLKGYVELVYDLNSNPSFRFFESLLYKSPYYNQEAQSIALWITDNDERPFCLSTPKLDSETVLHLDIPFHHTAIDQLSRMKRTAASYNSIRTLLAISDDAEPLFRSFFTDEAPIPYQRYEGDGLRMRYFGHACILIETKETSILIDPIISYYGYQVDLSRFSDIDLPNVIDYVLITHNHQDHILLETLLPLRHKIGKLIIPRTRSGALQDPNLKLMFNQLGFMNVVELDEMESVAFEDCTLTGIPFIGEHCDLNIQSKLCYHVDFGRRTALLMADSCNVEPKLYEHIHKKIGDVDIMFLGMECDGAPLTWLYGPLLTEDIAKEKDFSRRLAGSNYKQAVSLVEVFKPGEVYVYAMGLEPWLEFISSIRYNEEANPIVASNNLIHDCTSKGLVAERLYGEKEVIY